MGPQVIAFKPLNIICVWNHAFDKKQQHRTKCDMQS